MKKILILFAVVLIGFASCADSKQSMTITVTNPLALERVGEMVEVPMSDVVAKLKLADTAQIVVLDVDGQQVPYQVTYDEKVVFPATIAVRIDNSVTCHQSSNTGTQRRSYGIAIHAISMIDMVRDSFL